MGKTRTGSNQANSQHGYKWIQNFTPNEEAIAINTCGQRKLLEGPLPRSGMCQPHPREAPCSGVVD